MPTAAWDYVLKPMRSVLPHPLRAQHPGEKVHKLASALGKTSLDDVYRHLVSLWPDPVSIVPGAREPLTPLTDRGASLTGLSAPLARMSFLDLVTYLPDDILVKVDRAAMAVSLETRVPLLDHRVVEFAWRIPLEYKVRAGRGKHLLRAVLERYVPRPLFERPKMGFGVPIDHWLRGPLREWADHLLDPARLRSQGYFAVEPITRAWTEHREGRASHQYALWTILMFQAWLEHTDGR
jgi:asparagine synthase (glutamine-hydrolysing)